MFVEMMSACAFTTNISSMLWMLQEKDRHQFYFRNEANALAKNTKMPEEQQMVVSVLSWKKRKYEKCSTQIQHDSTSRRQYFAYIFTVQQWKYDAIGAGALCRFLVIAFDCTRIQARYLGVTVPRSAHFHTFAKEQNGNWMAAFWEMALTCVMFDMNMPA